MFKNKLFFSSKKSSDSSSPDGSNSPLSIGSNSPIRSDKKKPKSTASSKDATGTSSFSAVACRQAQVKDGVKKRELKGKEVVPSTTVTAATPTKPSVSKLNKGGEVPSSVSPILASSLGLNRIKTRSGPLPQERFFSFKGDKGSAAVPPSNLSRLGGGSGGYNDGNSKSGKSGSGGKKKEMGNKMESVGVLGDNVKIFDGVLIGNGGQSREQSPNLLAKSRLQAGGSSSEVGVSIL